MAKVLRSIFLEPDLDTRLATQAEQESTTKSELIRRYCVEGLERSTRHELELKPKPTLVNGKFVSKQAVAERVRAFKATLKDTPVKVFGKKKVVVTSKSTKAVAPAIPLEPVDLEPRQPPRAPEARPTKRS